MDHEMSVEVDAGYWLTAPHVCSGCQHEAPVTLLVATRGMEAWGNVFASINEPSFVIEIDGDLPLEVVRQRWHLNSNLGMPTQGERTVSNLTNVCQHCGTQIDDVLLIEPGGPFLPGDASEAERITCAALEHVPFTAHDAVLCEEDGLPALVRRIARQG